MKKNYIVLHYLNGRLKGRWDFGMNLAWAKDHMEFLENSVYQKGSHQIHVMEEHSPLTNEHYSTSFAI